MSARHRYVVSRAAIRCLSHDTVSRGLSTRVTSHCHHRQSCVRGLSTVTEEYYGLVDKGVLKEDLKQLTLLGKLDSLQEQLNNYQPPVAQSFFSRLFSPAKGNTDIRGLYVYGGVGCGKTMLMDMFFTNIDTQSKLRIHFHDFMLDVHERIHEFKSSLPPSHVKDRVCYDPIPIVAREIAAETTLLCFDEFQVTDVADAMILKRLFETLFAEGTIMIATGNRAPDDLYKNGLQRTNFLPFIPLLKKHCEVLDMDSLVDYRLVNPKPLTMIPGGVASFVHDDARLEELFLHLTGGGGVEATPRTLRFLGRELTVGVSHGTVLMTSYRELCERNHGSSDFRTLAKTYSHVLIKDFPQLSLKYKTPLRRFIVMMDLFYDRGVKLIISCHVPISQIIDLSGSEQQAEDELRLLMDDLQLTETEAREMNLFTGEDEVFSHKRAISRLYEMQCSDYWELPHKPGKLEK